MGMWKSSVLFVGLSFVLVTAGCGQDDSSGDSASVSGQLEHTITGIEPGSGAYQATEDALSQYNNLTGWQQESSSAMAMLTSLENAISNEEPIVVSAWSPHFIFAKYDLKYLEDPKGVFGEEEYVTTIAREGLKEDKPGAYTILDRFELDISDVESFMLTIQDQEIEATAENWVEDNQETVNEWTKGIEDGGGTSVDLAMTPWDDQRVSANIMKVVLDQKGYDTSITPVDPAVMFESVANGESDASLAPWMPITHGDLYAQYEDSFEDLGKNVTGAKIGLAVPEYMEDVNSIKDLKSAEQ
ncbi:glycine betaine ABC transporter substrate-binding protein [Salibacterium qingdaonense]|uniref:Glycine betaine/proline transport system substrate-binding protein n=1 Tax=Salibacterium qingdaonense TaxID=266892 RepID=A0A1I4QSH5_9BACI|nr:glycine betaine ABC transporter substrate-binding protein [Salibacterium qingdaonense]SFM42991.1 glycine betaine/proline transport system substrate-binding protein [Salibacterium qingdaonense]